MEKKSLTIDLDQKTIKNLHICAIETDVSRKFFIEKCVELVGSDKKLLDKVRDMINETKSCK